MRGNYRIKVVREAVFSIIADSREDAERDGLELAAAMPERCFDVCTEVVEAPEA